MQLNPFHPNYLKQIKFQPKRRSPEKHSAPVTSIKQPPSQQKLVPLVKSQTQVQKSQPTLAASFPLSNQFYTSSLAYTKQGCLFAFIKKLDNISGRSYIFFPQGMVACCNVINKKLTGWMVFFMRNEFYNVSHFEGGRFHGLHFSYDVRCGLIVQSQYKYGKLQSVRRGTADSQRSFEKCLKNQQIIDIFNKSINFIYLDDYFPKISSLSGNFYGEKRADMPSGIGIMLTEKQYFFGNFKRGVIDGQGTMVFSDGNSYTGQFQSGVMKNLGCYFQHGSIFYQDNQTAIRKQDFYSRRNLSSYLSIQILSNTFDQIFKYYESVSTIHLARKKKNADLFLQSFVDVEVQNQDEIHEERVQNDSAESPRLNQDSNQGFKIIEKLKNSGPVQAQATPSLSKGPKKLENHKNAIAKIVKQENHNQIKQKLSKGPKGRSILNEQEWQQIIEDLQGESVNKEDDFMKPKKVNNNNEEQQSNLKKNNAQASIDPRNMTNFRPVKQDQMQKLQNKILGKIKEKK